MADAHGFGTGRGCRTISGKGRTEMAQLRVRAVGQTFGPRGSPTDPYARARTTSRVLARVQRQPDRSLPKLLGVLPRCCHP
jgi:hypothetical protein